MSWNYSFPAEFDVRKTFDTSLIGQIFVLRISNFHGETISRYNPSHIFARAWLVYTRLVTEYSPAKSGEYLSDIPQYLKPRVLRKILIKDNKHNRHHLEGRDARIFVLGHYLFLKAHAINNLTL